MTNTELQWGHGWVAVEDSRIRDSILALAKLQWGHGWVAVEDIFQYIPTSVGVRTSMGPRLGSRGRPAPPRIQRDRRGTSMGPRLGSRGRPVLTRGKSLARGRLQWGHGWVAVEDLPERRIAPGAGATSMGPRLGSRGRPSGDGRVSLQVALQWGHGWVAVEDLSWPDLPGAGRTNFNGATAG